MARIAKYCTSEFQQHHHARRPGRRVFQCFSQLVRCEAARLATLARERFWHTFMPYWTNRAITSTAMSTLPEGMCSACKREPGTPTTQVVVARCQETCTRYMPGRRLSCRSVRSEGPTDTLFIQRSGNWAISTSEPVGACGKWTTIGPAALRLTIPYPTCFNKCTGAIWGDDRLTLPAHRTTMKLRLRLHWPAWPTHTMQTSTWSNEIQRSWCHWIQNVQMRQPLHASITFKTAGNCKLECPEFWDVMWLKNTPNTLKLGAKNAINYKPYDVAMTAWKSQGIQPFAPYHPWLAMSLVRIVFAIPVPSPLRFQKVLCVISWSVAWSGHPFCSDSAGAYSLELVRFKTSRKLRIPGPYDRVVWIEIFYT